MSRNVILLTQFSQVY